MLEEQIERARILIKQDRYQEAEKILLPLLANNPNDFDTILLLAEAYYQQDKIELADEMTDSLIGQFPDEPLPYYVKARNELLKDNWKSSEKYINEAISMDPEDDDFLAFAASLKLGKKKFEEALQLANQALELNPENIFALNTRSTALLKLNRKGESFTTIENALREDPNNSYTHTNFGWGLLEKGEPRKAMEHFKIALQNDPGFDLARDGLIEAIKARNILYRWFLKYSFWLSNLPSNFQWGFIIGVYLVFRLLSTIAKHNPNLQPIIIPIVVVLSILVYSTWIITPLSNLLFRLHKYGKYMLTREERISSNFVGLSLLIFLLSGTIYLLTESNTFAMSAAFGLMMMPTLGLMFHQSQFKNFFLYYAIGMSISGIVGICLYIIQNEVFNGFTILFLIAFMAFQWVANIAMSKEDN